MAATDAPRPRVRVDGKFFRLGDAKFFVKGVAYGPFQPDAAGEPFPGPERVASDFQLIRQLGANVARIYCMPPGWFLDLADRHGLKLFVDLPLHKQTVFLHPQTSGPAAIQAVRQAVRSCQGHPAVFAFCIVNEIPPDIARWSGAAPVANLIEDLIEAAKAEDPGCLCTFANFPPTEYLRPRNIDFASFNVYLHDRRPFENYLARLQMQSEGIPLVLSEMGVDSLRESEPAKCRMLEWQVEAAFRSGLAGAIIFSFTDDWFQAGRAITDWAMGLTTEAREPKDSFRVIQHAFAQAPYLKLSVYPRVSVVVACYNGARTLKSCLDSLERLNYPDYEILLVDDGSTDATPQIASHYETVRYLPQRNHGLSVARNSGIAAATGEIVAFTDADCRADEDWLYYLVSDLLATRLAGLGGPNLLPPEDSPVAAAVMVSPGGPAHVMLTDRLAEHIPGCNMAFYKWVLEEIGGFDPIFRRAGDDVDLCWRLQQRGYRLGFSPAGFVWHYRRSTVREYIKQQRGYGEAEALLERKHPEYFNTFGGSIWRGRIYTAARFGVIPTRSVIYHGVFGTGYFQTLYAGEPAFSLMLCTSLEYHVAVTLPLAVLSVPFTFLWPLAIAGFALSIAVCTAAAAQAGLPKSHRRLGSRPLVAMLFFVQPIVRGWARYKGRLNRHPTPKAALSLLQDSQPRLAGISHDLIQYWTDQPLDRVRFVTTIMDHLDRQGWTSKADAGWDDFDLEIYGNRWSRLRLTTVEELLSGGQRVFHCRLNPEWSLTAHLLFWSALASQLLLIGVMAPQEPWVWMILLMMPLLGWYLEAENRHLQRLLIAFLDHLPPHCPITRIDKPPSSGNAAR